MGQHPSNESISAYLDQAPGSNRLEIEAHLAACNECSQSKLRLETISASMRRLGDVSLTPQEHRRLRVALLEGSSKRAGWFSSYRILAGGLAACLIGVAGFLALAQQRRNAPTSASGPRFQAASFDFSSDQDIRRVVESQPEVKSAAGKYRASDAAGSPAKAVQAPQIGSAPSGDGSSSGRTATQQDQAAPQAESAARDNASSPSLSSAAPEALFTAPAGRECLTKVRQTQPYPLVPLLAHQAAYQGRPAWLLAYAWTPSRDQGAKLDKIQVWLIGPQDCATRSGDDLINRALHYSSSALAH